MDKNKVENPEKVEKLKLSFGAKELTRKQYIRANHVLASTLIFELIMFIVIELGTSKNDMTPSFPYWARIIFDLVFFTITALYTHKHVDDANGMRTMAIGYTLIYGLMVWTHQPITMAMSLPVMMVLMVFLNTRMILAACIVTFIFSITRTIYFKVQGMTLEFQQCNLFLMCLLICIVGGIHAIHRLMVFSKEDQAVIEKKSAKQKEVADTVSRIVDRVDERFQAVVSEMKGISDSMSQAQDSISSVAESTSKASEAVDEQLSMTTEIQGRIQDTTDVAHETKQTTDELLAAIKSGRKMSDELERQSGLVDQNTMEISAVVERLVENVGEVSKITEAILNITSQTNLLALNASIEAARAGEAGRGFAVVAEEIRQLADETKQSTESITKIIGELNKVTNETQEHLKASVESIELQRVHVQKVNESFTEVESGISSLANGINAMDSSVSKVNKANTAIVDSISTLSNMTSEVQVSMEDNLKNMEEMVATIDEFASVIDDTFEQMNLLKEATHD